MKRLPAVFVMVFLTIHAAAQVCPLPEQGRAEQRQRPAHDTLPVKVTPLPSTVNSRFSEYAGRLFPDSTFYFTSMRSQTEEDFDHLFETHWDCSIYRSKLLKDGSYEEAEMLPDIINKPVSFTSNYCFSDDGSLMIFSRCNTLITGELHCELWQTEQTARGWAKPKRLPETINKKGTTNMQPCLVQYPDYQVLFFVSNRPDGIGGLDIWQSVLKNGRFNAPVNLGTAVNTESNEATPFYDKDRKTLYFSSDEYAGLGGYDIFYSRGDLGQWGPATNMGVPFNSEFNDCYLTVSKDGMSGFFSSNRPSVLQSAEDTCCNDLFAFTFTKPDTAAQDTLPPAETGDTLTIQDKIASLLPIALYFENDHPDPKTLFDTTLQNYATLCRQYLAKQAQYIAEACKGLTGGRLTAVKGAMEAFFDDSVATGLHKAELLAQYLQEALAAGETVHLKVSGFASPLHHSDYNRHLAARRIASFLNYLHHYGRGRLSDYVSGRAAGLIIKADPQGAVGQGFETDNVSETVFGLRAATERKIVVHQTAGPHN